MAKKDNKKKEEGFSTAFPFGKPNPSPFQEAMATQNQPPVVEEKPSPSIYSDVQTGKASGIKVGENTFFGAEKDINKVAE